MDLYVIVIVATVLLLIVALSFFYGRKLTPPSKLKLRNSSSNQVGSLLSQVKDGAPQAKNLNVFFNYNGHTWDAYEVLGLPAGASLKMVKSGFEKSVASSQKESHEFLRTALEAILKDHAAPE